MAGRAKVGQSMQGNEGLSWESPQQAICKYIYLFRQIHFQLGQVYLLIWTTHTKSATSKIINPGLYWEWFQLEQFAKEFAKKKPVLRDSSKQGLSRHRSGNCAALNAKPSTWNQTLVCKLFHKCSWIENWSVLNVSSNKNILKIFWKYFDLLAAENILECHWPGWPVPSFKHCYASYLDCWWQRQR